MRLIPGGLDGGRGVGYGRGGSWFCEPESVGFAVRSTALRLGAAFVAAWLLASASRPLFGSLPVQGPFVIIHLSFSRSKKDFRSRIAVPECVRRPGPVKGSDCQDRTTHNVDVNDMASRAGKASRE